jgi:hypothetical protein
VTELNVTEMNYWPSDSHTVLYGYLKLILIGERLEISLKERSIIHSNSVPTVIICTEKRLFKSINECFQVIFQ